MIIELENTNAGEIGQRILTARDRVGVPTGLVFTMIVVADQCDIEQVVAAATDAGREHPSRILVLRDEDGPTSLDAQLRVGGEVPGDIIELTFRGELTRHRDSVVLPLLLPDSPVIAWWPGAAPARPADDPIGRLAHRRITDAMGSADSIPTLIERAHNCGPGDIDLVWTRLTRWRGLLAAALDQYRSPVRQAAIQATPGNAAGVLLAAWLDSRLEIETRVADVVGSYGIMGVELATDAGRIRLNRTDGSMATFSAPDVPQRLVALPRRDLNVLLTEELRRLDDDAAYYATMATLAARWGGEDDEGLDR
ncbi:MAG: glucose-6-phosphate dehydrogenase assembly protein OpcA [Actinobacteria bacterium]|nr:glucose-6-phosphate dehydrogenase assembly protein OpcA [Actinomycetota bacterium]